MATNYPINPRVRAYGKARLDIAGRATSQAQWEKLWKHPANAFPFVWGESWKQCIEYRVDDFPAEVGFFTDILGLPVNALNPDYAMFTSPKGDFFISVVPSAQSEPSTPPDAFRLQFMVQDILATALELQRRGIEFEQTPQPLHPGSTLCIASFRTPHGLSIELWAAGTTKLETEPATQASLNLSAEIKNSDDEDADDDEDDELISEPDGNGNEVEGEAESDDEAEDADEDDLGADLDEDEEDDFDIDEDEDDFDADDDDDEDEDLASLKTDHRKPVVSKPIPKPVEAKPTLPNTLVGSQKSQSPEYIDLEIT